MEPAPPTTAAVAAAACPRASRRPQLQLPTTTLPRPLRPRSSRSSLSSPPSALLLLLLLTLSLALQLLAPSGVVAIKPGEIKARERRYHPRFVPRLHRGWVRYEARDLLDCKFLRWKAFLKRGNGFCDGLPPFDVRSNRALVEECIRKYRREARKCFEAIRDGEDTYLFKFSFDASSEPCRGAACDVDPDEVHVHWKNHETPADTEDVADAADQEKYERKLERENGDLHPLDSLVEADEDADDAAEEEELVEEEEAVEDAAEDEELVNDDEAADEDEVDEDEADDEDAVEDLEDARAAEFDAEGAQERPDAAAFRRRIYRRGGW
ncbi:hypothetical protein HK405_005586 [Cladochytrium tenue]|nr:hypothetical protein HK405_005586 [Cladochytrium tenue]